MKKIWQWIRIDGLLHIETSALMVVAMSIVMPIWLAAVITMAVGILKEGYDKSHGGTPEMHDIWCDTIGMCLGVILAIL